MKSARLPSLAAVVMLAATLACNRPVPVPDEGPLAVTKGKLHVTGGYRKAPIDAVERISIDGSQLVLQHEKTTARVDLPAEADASQKNRGWALVTEGMSERARTFTFTQEMSLDDFTIDVPAAEGQLAYGSLGGRQGQDVVIFAYGSGGKAYWGWAVIEKGK